MWIDIQGIKPLHEAYLSAVGRAVAISQHLEETLKFVLNIVEIVEADKTDIDVFDRLEEIHQAVHRRQLGNTIDRLSKLNPLSETDFDTLNSGRLARNYLAHEAALVVSSFPERPDEVATRVSQFESHLRCLVNADNLVSAWSFLIQEKEAPPTRITIRYPRNLFSWAVAPLKDKFVI